MKGKLRNQVFPKLMRQFCLLLWEEITEVAHIYLAGLRTFWPNGM